MIYRVWLCSKNCYGPSTSNWFFSSLTSIINSHFIDDVFIAFSTVCYSRWVNKMRRKKEDLSTNIWCYRWKEETSSIFFDHLSISVVIPQSLPLHSLPHPPPHDPATQHTKPSSLCMLINDCLECNSAILVILLPPSFSLSLTPHHWPPPFPRTLPYEVEPKKT